MADYVDMFMSEMMIGADGYLKDIGLIVLPEEEREEWRQAVADRTTMSVDVLK